MADLHRDAVALVDDAADEVVAHSDVALLDSCIVAAARRAGDRHHVRAPDGRLEIVYGGAVRV